MQISSTNDPESQDSSFTKHKQNVIKCIIESNLNQAITSYSQNKEGQFKMPKLTDIELQQIYRNVSIITFAQNIPIGLKYYNNYAIATSTTNREYVASDSIYLCNPSLSSKEYHVLNCDKLTGVADISNNSTNNTDDIIIGYRNTDFILRSYIDEKEPDENKQEKDYTMHDVNQADYNCLIERSKYKPTTDTTIKENQEKAYYRSLAREKYVSRDTNL